LRTSLRKVHLSMRIKAFLTVVALTLTVALPLSVHAQSFSFPKLDELTSKLQLLLEQVKVVQSQIDEARKAATTTPVQPPRPPKYCTGAFNRTLSYGFKGEDVTTLQAMLAEEGYLQGGSTGFFGLATARAVREWQTKEGLISPTDSSALGSFGKMSRERYAKRCPGPINPPPLPSEPEPTCKVWYDGCNTCSRSEVGSMMMCTKMACIQPTTVQGGPSTQIWSSQPYCKEYFEGSVQKKELSVSTTKGPAPLTVEFKAMVGGMVAGGFTLQYGDGQSDTVACFAPADYCMSPDVRTHVYTKPGMYEAVLIQNNGSCDTARGMTCPLWAAREIARYTIVVTGSATGGTPTIAGVSGPVALAVGQNGLWKVSATDPENGTLNYAVKWGDESSALDKLAAMARPFYVGISQSSTFEHVYQAAGTYNPRFTVTDSEGNTVSSSISVVVGTQSTVCTLEYAPVCALACKENGNAYGCQNKTFSNTCAARAEGATVQYSGECSSAPGGIVCTNAGRTYTEGQSVGCIDSGSTGLQQCIADASYVCRKGQWKVEGGLPYQRY
jgi:peptidoglycan hydrolase-like protein with peptidoglycan-binding domain